MTTSLIRALFFWMLCVGISSCKARLTDSDLSLTGGNVALSSSYPETIQMLTFNGSTWIAHCSATLVSPRIAYSAAHCFPWSWQGPLLAVTGWRGIQVQKVSVHRHFYTGRSVERIPYDLAVLELSQDVEGPFAQIDSTPPERYDELVTVGFGCNRWVAPNELPKEFHEILRNLGVKWQIETELAPGSSTEKGMISTGTTVANQVAPNVCPGDSGGSLYSHGKLVAVTSHTNYSSLSYFTSLFSKESQALITEASTNRDSNQTYAHFKLRTKLTDLEFKAAVVALGKRRDYANTVDAHRVMLQEALNRKYSGSIRASISLPDSGAIFASPTIRRKVDAIRDLIVERTRRANFDLINSFQLPAVFINPNVDVRHTAVSRLLSFKLQEAGGMGSSFSAVLDENGRIASYTADPDAARGRRYFSTLGYSHNSATVTGLLHDIVEIAPAAPLVDTDSAPGLGLTTFYSTFGHNHPATLKKTLDAINNMAKQLVGVKSIFVILNITEVQNPEQLDISQVDIYIKEKDETSFRKI